MAELMYVSWGGSGRVTAVRAAVERARDAGARLAFLAVLDETFDDVEATLTEAVSEELAWLVSAQLRLVSRELNAEGLATRVLVRRGPLLDIVPAAVKESDVDRVLLGAPVSLDDEAMARLEERAGVPVEKVGPEQA
ncbi:MAG: hypothetical protein ACI91O_001525 [Candidatus Poriferisodalaceae bacterium]|jgi:hypothetical protein